MKNQCLPIEKLNIIFNVLVMSKITYALVAWGGFLNETQRHLIDGFLHKAKRWAVSKVDFDFNELLVRADWRLFSKIQGGDHCLNWMLPSLRPKSSELRPRGHNYVLPKCRYDLHKDCFINRCLFKFV